jgi:hypothetical protein|tara:strand:+ start:77 stop:922 length:846 start_codon:yes stop_codon:yes gene_type:complete
MSFFNVVGAVVVLSSLASSVKSAMSTSSSSSGGKEPVVIKPKSDTVDDLEKLKEKLKDIESTPGTETYTVQGNPGLSVGGTVLEQLLDISIAFFKQPLINEALQKIIKDESDAKVITDTVKEIGGEIVKVLKEKQVLACAKGFKCEQEGTSGDGKITCDGQEVGTNWSEARMHIADKNLYSSDKTGQCDRYIPDLKNIESIYETLKTKMKSMMTDAARQRLLYDTAVSIGKNNIDFFAMHDPRAHHYTNKQGNPFEEGGDFHEHMPYEKFQETATNFSNQF